ncbi:MAG TPA: hypothetical protein DD861_05815 [Erythrobacter sp.]|nr:hypothetical protein [Erythrobacter sp.]
MAGTLFEATTTPNNKAFSMIDRNQVCAPLVRNFIRLASLAEQEGHAIGSTSEQIVAALINDRCDWLPSSYPEPLHAIKRLHAGGADWWHTALYVHGLSWRE